MGGVALVADPLDTRGCQLRQTCSMPCPKPYVDHNSDWVLVALVFLGSTCPEVQTTHSSLQGKTIVHYWCNAHLRSMYSRIFASSFVLGRLFDMVSSSGHSYFD